MNKETIIVRALRNVILDKENLVKDVEAFEKTGSMSTHLHDVEAILKDAERRILEVLVRP